MELLPPIGMHGGVLYGKRANLTIARAAYACSYALIIIAAAVLVLANARPRLLAHFGSDAYAAYLQGVFAVGKFVAKPVFRARDEG